MENITNDKRTSLLDRSSFINETYKIDDHVYMVKNDLFFKMSKILNTSRIIIDAMLILENNIYIIIVPVRSYVFWNGRSIEPLKYNIMNTGENIALQEQISKGLI